MKNLMWKMMSMKPRCRYRSRCRACGPQPPSSNPMQPLLMAFGGPSSTTDAHPAARHYQRWHVHFHHRGWQAGMAIPSHPPLGHGSSPPPPPKENQHCASGHSPGVYTRSPQPTNPHSPVTEVIMESVVSQVGDVVVDMLRLQSPVRLRRETLLLRRGKVIARVVRNYVAAAPDAPVPSSGAANRHAPIMLLAMLLLFCLLLYTVGALPTGMVISGAALYMWLSRRNGTETKEKKE